MDFNEIYGHKANIDFLKKSIENNKISHSYLFQGQESIGKKMVATAFGKTLLCQRQGTEPCNRCSSCLKMDSLNHPDFTVIEPDKNIITMKQIKEFVHKVHILPLEGKRKIVIINDAHKMRSESQNALLKTLEEPPPYLNIILILPSSINILGTIRSRCEILNFYPLNQEEIKDYISSKYDIKEEVIDFISKFTKGNIGYAIEICESSDYLARREETISIIDKLVMGDLTKVFTSKEFFNKNKDYIGEILDTFLYWFRDLVLYKEIGDTDLYINIDKMQLLEHHSFVTIFKIHDIIESVENTRGKLNRNANFQLAIETMLLDILEVKHTWLK